MLVDRLQRRLQHPVIIGFEQHADRQLGGIVGGKAGGKQDRHSQPPRDPGQVGAVALARQPHVGQDQVDPAFGQPRLGLGHPVDRRHHRIAGGLDHGFIVERSQRFVLDHQDVLDELLALAEQHGPCFPLA